MYIAIDMTKFDPNILLVQIREDPEALKPERKSFVELSGLTDEHFHTLDVYRKPFFDPQIIDSYDAMIIGGMSDDPSDTLELSEDQFPFMASLNALIGYAIQIRKPSLLSCGGFMIASAALGGEIAIVPEYNELGVYDIHLTREGKHDILFRDYPASFPAVSGHIKSTIRLPRDCVLLASSDRCPIHAFKAINAPFYAFQFHPEIRCEELEDRVRTYKHKYFDDDAAYEKFISLLEDTSDANLIIRSFVNLINQLAHI